MSTAQCKDSRKCAVKRHMITVGLRTKTNGRHDKRRIPAEIFAGWAVHRSTMNRREYSKLHWSVTHIASGRCGPNNLRYPVAKRAAKALAKGAPSLSLRQLRASVKNPEWKQWWSLLIAVGHVSPVPVTATPAKRASR